MKTHTATPASAPRAPVSPAPSPPVGALDRGLAVGQPEHARKLDTGRAAEHQGAGASSPSALSSRLTAGFSLADVPVAPRGGPSGADLTAELPPGAPPAVDRAQDLPHREVLQRCFGREHDLSGVRARIGPAAAGEARTLHARAFTRGAEIGFARWPSLELAAHEAAHVIQQRRGASRGAASELERMERHADAVAGAVTAGRSAARLLSSLPARSPLVVTQLQSEASAPSGANKLFVDPAKEDRRNEDLQRFEALRAELRRVIRLLDAGVQTARATGARRSGVELSDRNSNIRSTLLLLRELLGELEGGPRRLQVGFLDTSEKGVRARYDTVANVIHVRRFELPDAAERRRVLIDLFHEFAHAERDRDTERVLLANPGVPVRETRQDAVDDELDAYRQEGYFDELLDAFAPGARSTGNDLKKGIVKATEDRREGRPGAADKLATLRDEVQRRYRYIHADKFPSVQHAIEVQPDGRAVLRGPGSERRSLTRLSLPINPSAAILELRNAIRGSRVLLELFAGAERPKTLIFSVIFGDAIVTEFPAGDPLTVYVDLTGPSFALYDAFNLFHPLTLDPLPDNPAQRDRAIRQAALGTGVFQQHSTTERAAVRLILKRGEATIGEIKLQE